jgi:hypothetical protein
MGAEVAPQRVPRQLGDLAGHLDAGGAAPATTNVSQASRAAAFGSPSAASKAARSRLRTASALSSDFTSAACSRHSSWPRYE